MPATRSILSVVRLMLEAGLPHDEILRTLDSCERAMPKRDRHPVDLAPFPPAPPAPPECGYNGDKPFDGKWIDQHRSL